MVLKYKRQLIASAVISALTTPCFADQLSTSQESYSSNKSTDSNQRYIVQYERSKLTKVSSDNHIHFDTQMAAQQLNERGIEIKRSLPRQAAFAVELSDAQLNSLKLDPNIKSIEKDQLRKFTALYEDTFGDPNTTQLTPYAIIQSQADQLTLQEGQKVCVIDSGLAGSDGETGGLNNDFEWSKITGDDDSGTGSWNADGGPHGTHVAGTVGAADNGFGVIGMAPGVAMHIIKVFNDAGWGYSSDLAHAADKCTEAGANIITMSLGGGGASSFEENAFNTFTENGGLVLAAAGNDGNDVRSYPAGYDSVMMVGANDGDNNIASFSQFPSCNEAQTNCVEVTAGGVNTLSTYPSGGVTIAGLTADETGYAASAMENVGSATAETFFMGLGNAIDSNANGKICVIDRGEITFHDKVKNCEDSGGNGAIIINNVSGMLNGTLGDTNTTSIPVVGTTLEDRDALVAATAASISVGPGDYGLMSGTSMATPGVAGVAALVWSNFPHCTGAEIRHALKVSAEDSGAPGHDVYFGNGIVKAKATADYLTANGCEATPPAGNVRFELASETIDEGVGTFSVTIQRNNGTFGEVSFDVSTNDDSATSASDYVTFEQTIVMADGETSKTISIEVTDDSEYEGESPEVFTLNLSNPSANTQIAQPNQMQISISENDPMPPAGDFVLSSASYNFDEDATEVFITINRVNGDYGQAMVDLVSSEDTATNDVDYQAISQTVVFENGETSKEIIITLIDDNVFEGDETFSISLQNPSERSTIESPVSSTVTINENEPPPPAGDLSWTQSTLVISEASSAFVVEISRDNGSYGECIATATVSHSSTDASDFSGDTSVELVFADGEISQTATFSVFDDTIDETDESFSLVISSQSDCSIGVTANLSVTITDNDESQDESGGGSLSWSLLLLLGLLRRAK
ncbi:S8 family serine peptidase [Aliikangiella marina]|uniref:S8 family serine peptidase n=1 Tax=Aliikangiella marina TaxID=1712262 RepID=A0A545T996_9GAMM|nr:Calx-beta domain-containing protein [Aliikangiella marina]TQV73790.1 S8 family serine peptidase [Aliikangiella marina]